MDNSPTALFDSYEQDFKQIVQSIRGKLEGDAQDAQAGEQRKAALRRVEMELDEADEMVRVYLLSSDSPLPEGVGMLWMWALRVAAEMGEAACVLVSRYSVLERCGGCRG